MINVKLLIQTIIQEIFLINTGELWTAIFNIRETEVLADLIRDLF